MKSYKDKPYWLDQKSNINKILYILYAACVLLLIVEFFYHKHTYFSFENWLGFYAWFGFLAYTFIIISAKLLRKLIKRDEHYYD